MKKLILLGLAALPLAPVASASPAALAAASPLVAAATSKPGWGAGRALAPRRISASTTEASTSGLRVRIPSARRFVAGTKPGWGRAR